MGTWLLCLFCLTAARQVWASGHPVWAVVLAVGSLLLILGWKGRESGEPTTSEPASQPQPATLPMPQPPQAVLDAMRQQDERQRTAAEREKAEERARREHERQSAIAGRYGLTLAPGETARDAVRKDMAARRATAPPRRSMRENFMIGYRKGKGGPGNAEDA